MDNNTQIKAPDDAQLASVFLNCPECDTPAIRSSSVIDGHPSWTEDDDEVWCPGCGCLLYVFITGDQESEWCEARVSEYSGRDWRLAIGGALEVDVMSDEHTPDQLADVVSKQLADARERIKALPDRGPQ